MPRIQELLWPNSPICQLGALPAAERVSADTWGEVYVSWCLCTSSDVISSSLENGKEMVFFSLRDQDQSFLLFLRILDQSCYRTFLLFFHVGNTVPSASGWGGGSIPGDFAADRCCLGTSAPRMSDPFHLHPREFRVQEESAKSQRQPGEEAVGEAG